jgi:hypothetical protein
MANQTMTNIEPFVDSAPLLNSPEELRVRAAERGYLFFRALLDQESVLDLRRQILEVCQKHGWLDEEAPLMDAISRDGRLFIEGNSPEWIAFYTDVQRLRAFNALALRRKGPTPPPQYLPRDLPQRHHPHHSAAPGQLLYRRHRRDLDCLDPRRRLPDRVG